MLSSHLCSHGTIPRVPQLPADRSVNEVSEEFHTLDSGPMLTPPLPPSSFSASTVPLRAQPNYPIEAALLGCDHGEAFLPLLPRCQGSAEPPNAQQLPISRQQLPPNYLPPTHPSQAVAPVSSVWPEISSIHSKWVHIVLCALSPSWQSRDGGGREQKYNIMHTCMYMSYVASTRGIGNLLYTI